MRGRVAAGMIVVATLAAACVGYHPVPLTRESVDAALATPTFDALRVDAAELHHPALPPVHIDLADGMSPDEAAVLAVLLNPGLRAERGRLALADAQVLGAGVLPNPELSYGREVPDRGQAETITGFAAAISMGINDLVTRRSRVAASRAGRESVALDVAWREWQAAEAAKTGLYALIALGEQEALARDADERAGTNLDLVRHATEDGQLTAADLAAAGASRAEARAALIEARAAREAQRIALDALLGLPEATAIAVQAGFELPVSVTPRDPDDLRGHLEDRRLDLQALHKGYESREAALRAAVLGRFPRISLGLTRAKDTAGIKTHGLALTLDIPIFDRNQGAIAEATAERRQLFDEYTARVFEARAEIAGALDEVRALGESIRAADSGEAAAKSLDDTYREALGGAQVSAIDAVAAWTTYQHARIHSLELRVRLVEARVRLELAAGLYDIAGETR